MSVWELPKPKRVTYTKNGKVAVGTDERVIRVKQGIRINDADEGEMCRRNECDVASKMSPKHIHESPEWESRSWCHRWCNDDDGVNDIRISSEVMSRVKARVLWLIELSSGWRCGQWWTRVSSVPPWFLRLLDPQVMWSLLPPLSSSSGVSMSACISMFLLMSQHFCSCLDISTCVSTFLFASRCFHSRLDVFPFSSHTGGEGLWKLVNTL